MRYDVTIAALAPRAIAELRGDATQAQHWLAEIGCRVPARPNRCARDAQQREVLWLGPRRWLLFAPADDEDRLAAAVASTAAAPLICATIVTDMLAGVAIAGPQARDVISQGTPLDLDALPADGATMTDMFGVPALVRTAAPPGFEVWVDRSVGRYLMDCLDAAAGTTS